MLDSEQIRSEIWSGFVSHPFDNPLKNSHSVGDFLDLRVAKIFPSV